MSTMLVLFFWAVAAGTVTAGMLSSFYRLVTAEPVSFGLLVNGGFAATLLSVPLLLLAGPAVVARHAMQALAAERNRGGGLMLLGVLLAGWCFVNGVVVLEFLLAVRNGFA